MNRLAISSLVLLALVCSSLADPISVNFAADVNVTVGGTAITEAEIRDNGLGFRLMTNAPLSGLLTGSFVSSTGIFVSESGGEIDIEIDAAYYNSKGFVAVNSRYAASGFSIPGVPLFSWDASASANLIAQFPYAIVEVDTNGADVMVHKMEDFAWSLINDFTVAAAASGSISVKGFVGTLNGGAEGELKIYAQTSAAVGVSTFVNENLLPKTWAITMDFSKYVLQTASNSIRLQMAIATGSADVSSTGTVTVSGPDTKLDAYAELASAASFNGSSLSVSVSAFFEVNKATLSSLFPEVNTQLGAKYDAEVHLYMANCTFAAGSTGFVYSTRSGTGTRLGSIKASGPSSAASTVSFSYAIFVAILAIFGFFAF